MGDESHANAIDMLEELLDLENGLTHWEMNFIDDVRRQLDAKKRLSANQIQMIQRIYVDRTP